jgi:hypothetical protein
MEIVHKQITGDKTAVKKHGNNEIGGEEFAVRQILPRQGVSCKYKKQYGYYGPAEYIDKGIDKGNLEKGIIQYPQI